MRRGLNQALLDIARKQLLQPYAFLYCSYLGLPEKLIRNFYCCSHKNIFAHSCTVVNVARVTDRSVVCRLTKAIAYRSPAGRRYTSQPGAHRRHLRLKPRLLQHLGVEESGGALAVEDGED